MARRRRLHFHSVRKALGRWRTRLSGGVVVLMYHRVAEPPSDPWELCVSRRHFEEQLSVLARTLTVIRPADLNRALEVGKLPRRSVLITFDDGYADNLLAARPLLERYGLPATFFVATESVLREREFWWDELERLFLYPGTLPETLELTIDGRRRTWSLGTESRYLPEQWERHRTWCASSVPRTVRQRVFLDVWNLMRPLPGSARESLIAELSDWAAAPRDPRSSHRALTADEVPRLAAGGQFDVGCHTVSHAQLTALPHDRQKQEIRVGKEQLESIVQQPIRYFSYPYGDGSAETEAIVRESGFAAAFTVRERTLGVRNCRWRLPRFKVRDWSGEEFARRLSMMFTTV